MEDLSNTVNQRDLTEMFRTFYPAIPESTFFSSGSGTFSRVSHVLGHKRVSINLKRLKSHRIFFSFLVIME